MGGAAPGLPDGTSIGAFSLTGFGGVHAFNDDDQLVFGSKLVGATITPQNDSCIWFRDNSGLSVLAREGEQIPNTNLVWGDLTSKFPLLNQSGHSVFSASLSGSGVNTSNDTAFWLAIGDEFSTIAREGDQAPGLPAGVLFGDFSHAIATSFNGLDQVVFLSKLIGSGVDFSNNEALWVRDPNSGVRLLGRKGDIVEIAPGDFRTISQLIAYGSAGHQTGHLSGLSENGMLAYGFRFTDDALISYLTTVPEPTSVVLLLAGISILASRRRRAVDKKSTTNTD